MYVNATKADTMVETVDRLWVISIKRSSLQAMASLNLEGNLFLPSLTKSGIASENYHWPVSSLANGKMTSAGRGIITPPGFNVSLQ